MADLNKLTDPTVKQAKPKGKAYRLPDGAGMYVEISPSGAKRFYLKYRFDGKEDRLSLGVYPKTTIKKARLLNNLLKRPVTLKA